jgi:hypothetical protein
MNCGRPRSHVRESALSKTRLTAAQFISHTSYSRIPVCQQTKTCFAEQSGWAQATSGLARYRATNRANAGTRLCQRSEASRPLRKLARARARPRSANTKIDAMYKRLANPTHGCIQQTIICMIGLARLKTMCNDRRGVLSLGNGRPTRRHRVTMRNGFLAATCLREQKCAGSASHEAKHRWTRLVSGGGGEPGKRAWVAKDRAPAR